VVVAPPTRCRGIRATPSRSRGTAGEAIHDRHGNTLDAKGLKRLRERLRVLSGDTVGGSSLEDLAQGISRRIPDLPPLPRTTASVAPLRLTFDELWAKLKAGHCAVLNGNPIRVKDPAKRGQQSSVERVRRQVRERTLLQARDAIEALRRAA
jgi:hypothetical protein